MRMMLKVTVPTENGNRALKDGSMPRLIAESMEKLKPEAAYFTTEDGQRCGYMFFELNDVSEIPGIAEPLFLGLGANVDLVPVMNREELEKGLSSVARML